MADSTVGYKQSDDPDVLLEVNDGDIGGKVPIHDVRSLPAQVTADIGSISSDCTDIKNAVTGPLTINLPSGAATAANQSTGNTTLSSILSGLSSLATSALQSTANTTLSTISSTLSSILSALNPSTFVAGQTAVNATDTTLSSQVCTFGAWVINNSTGGQIVYVRKTSVTTSNGYPLAPGAERFFPCRDVNELHAIGSAGSASVAWEAI